MTEAKSTAATFIDRVREILNSSTPNLVWEVGTPVKILRGHLTGFGPDFVEMQVPVPGATPMIVIRLEDIVYIARGSTTFEG